MSELFGCTGRLARTFKAITLALLFALSVLVVFPSSVKSHQYRAGRIEGTVIDLAGLPVPNATVYVLQNGRTPASVTDARGNFVLTDIPVGEQRIFAYKESDNYANPVWSFYDDAQSQEGFPLVRVREDRPLRNVIVRLGPKSSRLLSGAAISLNHVGKPKTLLNPGASRPSGEFTVLIPARIPVNIKVTAAGYKPWTYRDRTSKPPNAIELKTGENRSIKVELSRSYEDPAK